jgi:hypothetical protein
MTMRGMSIAFCCLVSLVAVNCRDVADIERESERAAAEINANEGLAEPILMAIERYDEEHGHPPEELSSLLPAYLSAIPKTVGGQDFRYELNDIDRYYLCFDVLSKPSVGCCYYGRLDFWDCSMGD